MDDRELSALLHEAVADVEPADRLGEIRQAVSPRPSRRRWYAAGGGVLAAVAAVTAIAVLTTQGTPKAEDPGPVATPTTTPSATTSGGPGDPRGPATPVYYLGDTSQGLRLFREFDRVGQGDPGQRALAGLMAAPADPDYRTVWSSELLTGSVSDPEAGIVVVFVHESARNLPRGMSAERAELSIQQVVYTLQAAHEDPTLAVQFRTTSNPIDQVLGVPTAEPLAAAPQLDVLALVSISDPSEGRIVDGSFTARGRASAFEGTVVWELRDSQGGVVRDGFATAGMEDHLVPWETEPIDVSDLEAGSYTFVASTTDPSDGEGVGVFTDTRTVVVR
jgi:hypothetical protein